MPGKLGVEDGTARGAQNGVVREERELERRRRLIVAGGSAIELDRRAEAAHADCETVAAVAIQSRLRPVRLRRKDVNTV